jgi:hypothetical protein
LISIRYDVIAMLQGGISSNLVNSFSFFSSFGGFFIGVLFFVILASKVLFSPSVTEEAHEQQPPSAIRKTTKKREDKS